jgi:predicted phage terminase large subunit-like protein
LPPLHAAQVEVVNNLRRFSLLRAGRQWGKSFIASMLGIRKALSAANQTIMVVAPTYRQTEHVYGDIVKLLRPLINFDMGDGTPFVTEYKADHRLEFYNGSVIMAASGDKPDRLRGFSIDLIILDEAAMMESGEELWYMVVRPALAVTRGEALFISTPKGKDNWFYELYCQAENDIEAKGDESEWALFHSPSYDSPYFPDEEAEAYRALGENFYAQEIEAEFTATKNRIISVDNFHYYATTVTEEGNFYFNYGTNVFPEKSTLRAMTIDLATSVKTSADYTAFAIGDITRNGMCFVRDVYRARIPGPEFADIAVERAKRNHVDVLYVESVGYQLSAVQELQARGLTVEKLIAKGDKIARATQLGIRMFSEQVLYPKEAPWMPSTRDEITSFPDGKNDDRVDALGYLSIVSAQYAASAGPVAFGAVSLDRVAQNAQSGQPIKSVFENSRIAARVAERKRSTGMALEGMRGPLR